MEKSKEYQLEYYRSRAIDYEWLFKEQKEISDGYKNLVNIYRKDVQDKDLEIFTLKKQIKYYKEIKNEMQLMPIRS
jgi:hypothetical protein